jgi:type IV secretion system protein TrbL
MPPINADPGVLTNLLNAFLAVFGLASGNLTGEASRLLLIMAAVELTLAGIYWSLRGENLVVGLLQKVLLIGLFMWFVANWAFLGNSVLNGFIWAGATAGGMNATQGIALMNDPSQIISQAFAITGPLSTQTAAMSWTSLGEILMFDLAELFILIGYFILAIQVFITLLEFYIVSGLSLILVPFGVFKHTAFLAERALGTVISFGIKLMVLTFIVAASSQVMNRLAFPAGNTITLQAAYCVMLAALAVAFLAWNAPSVAAGMISGGPSLTAGTVAGAGAAVAAGGFALFQAARAAGSTLAGATRAAAGAAGTVRTAGALGAAAAEVAGTSRTMGAASGIAQAGVSAVREATTGGLRQAYAAGSVRAFRYTGGTAPDSVQARASAAGRPAATQSPMRSAMEAARTLRSVIPPEGHPSGGIHAPIRPE